MPIGIDAGDLAGDPAPSATDDDVVTAFTTERAGQLVLATVWTRWSTAEDERVCPECGPLDRLAWPADEGPQPPLHRNCRCTREFAFLDFGVRGWGQESNER